MTFAEALQTVEWQVGGRRGFNYPPVGLLHPPASVMQVLVDAIGEVDIRPLALRTDPTGFLIGLGAAADAAMPWQPPHVRDALAALPPVIDALRPVGAVIAAAPAAEWWTSPVDLDHQYEVAGEPHARFAPMQPARTALRAIRAGSLRIEARFHPRPEDPADEPGGEWGSRPGAWAGPDATVRPSSSRRLLGIGAIELAAEEDSFGPEHALLRQIRPIVESPRIFEIRSPADWQRLVADHPFDVSRSRRGVWWQSTGLDTPWYLPDWLSAARDYDAVHLTVQGYLTTAGEALPVPGGHTVLAGWNPDVTYWLCDITTGPVEHWHRTTDDTANQWDRISP